MKTISLLALLLCIAPCLTAEGNKMTGVGMLSTNSMMQVYGFNGLDLSSNRDAVRLIDRAIQREVGSTEGRATLDTPEEFLTATYFSPIEIQDAQARIRIQEVLPQDNPSVAGARLGAMWYQKLVAYQFAVADTPESREQIGRYELIMNTISERTGATRAEMVATFRAGVREIVAEKVEREFNKIQTNMDTDGVLITRETINDQIMWSLTFVFRNHPFSRSESGYLVFGAYNEGKTIEEVEATEVAIIADFLELLKDYSPKSHLTLSDLRWARYKDITFYAETPEALIDAYIMARIEIDRRWPGRGIDYGYNDVTNRARKRQLLLDRAEVIPGVVFDNWARLSDGNVDNIPLIVDMITNFYLDPNEDNFMLLAQVTGRTIRLNQTAPEFYTAFGSSFISSVAHLSRDLSGRINRTLQDRGPTYLANLSMPPRYSTLWTPYVAP